MSARPPIGSMQARRDRVWDLRTWGTYRRASAATYWIASPSDDPEFLLDGYNNLRRIEDTGDGPTVLLEGWGKNWFHDSDTFLSWTHFSAVITENAGPAPDGSNAATRLQTPSGGTGASFGFVGVPGGLDWTGSLFRRAFSGTTSAQELIGASAGHFDSDAALGETYERAIMEALPANSATSMSMWVADGRNLVSFGGIAAGARDELTWGRQLEQFPGATSYMRSNEAVGGTVRKAGRLSGPMSTVPRYVIDGPFTFDLVPVLRWLGSVRLGVAQVLFSFAEDDSEYVALVPVSGALHVRVVSGGVTKVTSAALTYGVRQRQPITIDPATGSITVAGATAGNGTTTGTPWTWNTGPTMHVGSLADGSLPAYVAFGVPDYTPNDERLVLFMLGQSNMQGLHLPYREESITGQIAGAVQGTFRRAKKVDCVSGGTSLVEHWSKDGVGDEGGDMYENMLSTWSAAVTKDPSLLSCTPVIVWGQGESDASSIDGADDYGTNLAAFFEDLASDIPFFANCKIVIHALSPTNGIDTSPGQTRNAQIRSAQQAYAAAHPSRVALIETSDLTTYDGVHYDTESTEILAERDAAAIRGWFA